MKIDLYRLSIIHLLIIGVLTLFASQAFGQRHMENLGRGLVAVRTSSSEVYIGWRLLATDPADIRFNVYLNGTTLINNGEPTIHTNITHTNSSTISSDYYIVKPVINGMEQQASAPATVWSTTSLRVQLQRPAGGTTPAGENYTYSPSDCSVGDLDGDGEYEIIVKWEPGNAKDNSQTGYTGNVYLDAYKLDGRRLWRIDLGRNIRGGAHYTQFIVYDLDSDGKAELACKTAPNTKDGTGSFLSMGPAANDNDDTDYRTTTGDRIGYILSGPEYLTVFNGETGAEMATTNYIPGRSPTNGWGNTSEHHNRVDRFLAGVGYFDGEKPSLLMCRGYYGRSVLVAWDWRNGQLTQRWLFDSNASGNSGYGGMGFHSLSINDVDGDRKDEVVYGSMVLDHDGKGLYTTRLGHGDALHVSDMDPDRPGLEVWTCQESPTQYAGLGLRLRDARTGANIFGVPATDDVGRALAADIDPNHKGMELWGSRGGLYNVKGEQIETAKPSINFAVWWDADLQREMLDGNQVRKWNPASNNTSVLLDMTGHSSNNSTKSTPNLSADILGDWREEVIMRSNDNTSLSIFTTPTPYYSNTTTNPRFYTLMHDPQYRISIAWQNVGYNQPPHTSFYLGGGMDLEVPKPNIRLAGTNITGLKGDIQPKGQKTIFVYPNPSTDVFQINALGAYSYTIYDQLGRTMETGTGVDEGTIGTNLKAGVYTVRIETRTGSKVERILKQ